VSGDERNEHLGAAAELLEHRGDVNAAALLLDVQTLTYRGHEIGWRVIDGRVTATRGAHLCHDPASVCAEAPMSC
jgi:hypothetical protein